MEFIICILQKKGILRFKNKKKGILKKQNKIFMLKETFLSTKKKKKFLFNLYYKSYTCQADMLALIHHHFPSLIRN